jgi:hypothetical protein
MTAPRDTGREHADPGTRRSGNTPIWRLAIFPAQPVYRQNPRMPARHRGTPSRLGKPVASTTSTASSSARGSTTGSRALSRRASASQRPRPRIARRQGPGSPGTRVAGRFPSGSPRRAGGPGRRAGARVQPVSRRSSPSTPSINRPADAAARSRVNSRVNNARIRAFASRGDAAQGSSLSRPPGTSSDLRIKKRNCSVRSSESN